MTERIMTWIPSSLDEEIMALLSRGSLKEVGIFHRKIRRGEWLRAIRSCDPPEYRWHLSVRHEAKRKRRQRWPSLTELNDAVDELIPVSVQMWVYFPPPPDAPGGLFTWHLYQEPPPRYVLASQVPTDSVPFDGDLMAAKTEGDFGPDTELIRAGTVDDG